jgi:hypothetical protein
VLFAKLGIINSYKILIEGLQLMKKDIFYCMTLNVSWQKHKDTLYVIDERNGSIYPFSGISFLVYGKYSLNQTINKISEKYNAERNIVEEDITEFIRELIEIEILESVV